MVGRHTDFNDEIAQKICDLILDGNSIRSICSFVDMPHVSTVMRWLKDHNDFAKSYTLAKQQYAEFIFDEILEIADQCPMDKDSIAKARLMIDARKYTVSKLAPKKYGSKVEDVDCDEYQDIQINIVRATKQIGDLMNELSL
jgi:hypothetical protein